MLLALFQLVSGILAYALARPFVYPFQMLKHKLRHKECLFCKLVRTKQQPVLYEDDQLYIVEDLYPDAQIHLLVIPKQHIKDNRSLFQMPSTEALSLLQSMKSAAIDVLKLHFELTSSELPKVQYLFHAFPFYSIPHLHLHVLYGTPKHKSHSFFVQEGFWWIASLESVQKKL